MMRPFLLPLLALMLTGSAIPRPATPAPILAAPVALDARDPGRVKVGPLRYLGGWVLTSSDARFGGISAMVPMAGGLLAVSDRGAIFSIRTRGNRPPTGRVEGVLPDGPAHGIQRSGRDVEALAINAATGQLWAAFEAFNAVWRYPPSLGRAEAHGAPSAMTGWPRNGGAEAMLRFADGRFLILCEECDQSGPTEGLFFASDPAEPGAVATRFRYRAPSGHRVTDMAALPDGRLLVLHRRFTIIDGVSAALSLVDRTTITRGALVQGREIARLASPLTVDNMEALAVTREAGDTILWIASDDNFSAIQRTLLLKFRLEGRR